MQRKYLLLLTLTILGFFTNLSMAKENPNGMTTDRVEIHSVSTQIDLIDYQPYGSINGGTIVHLKAYGHNRQPSKNKINIGPYDCVIEENGISGDNISCRTTVAFDNLRRYNQVVELHVEGKLQSSCFAANSCRFSYRDDRTPVLKLIEPSVATPNSFINWNAIWRLTNTGQITKLTIGEHNCDRFMLGTGELVNLNDADELSSTYNYLNVPCQLSPNIPAGLYEVTTEMLFGEFWRLPTSRMLTADGTSEYEFVVTAEVTSIDQNVGSESGNQITINGSGFDINSENAEVSVGGIACDIVTIDNNKIVCNLAAATTETPVTGGFQKGQGVTVSAWQFDATDGMADYNHSSLSAFQTAKLAGTIPADRKYLDDITRGNWEIQYDSDYSRTGTWARGFFKAPRTGNYKFWLSADDSAKVYLNTTPNDTSFSEGNIILEKTSYTSFRQYFHPNSNDYRQETGQTLQEGQFYWVEVYAYNYSGYGHFTLSVEAPAINSDAQINSVDQIQEFKIETDKINQRWNLKMWGDEDQSFQFKYTNPKTRKVDYLRTTSVKKWDAWSDSSILSSFNWAAGYYESVLVSTSDIDENGGQCIGNCIPAGKEYVIDFTLYRAENRNITPTCTASKCSVVKEQEQSPPIRGTYSLTFGGEDVQVWVSKIGWTTDIPYHYSADNIKSGLKLLNDEFINVEVYTKGRSDDGRTLGFNFKSLEHKENYPILSFDDTNLTGGKAGTSPSIQGGQVLSAGNESLYEPIPFDMSFVSADAPHVSVIINGVPSVCSGNCEYQTSASNTPTVEFKSETSGTLTFDVSASTVAIDASNIQLQYGGSKCHTFDFTSPSDVTCVVDSIQAGDNKPVILIASNGYATITGSAVSSDPVITTLTPATGSIQGGIQITIVGTGFPISDVSAVSVTFGSSVATVISTTNTQIVVDLPVAPTVAQAETVTIVQNGKTSNVDIQFTYSTVGLPTVTSLNPVNASPVKKGDIIINGTDFGSDYTAVEVWLLKDGVQTYQLNPQETGFTTTSFTARLGGGHVGDYQLRVIKSGVGYSLSNPSTAENFSYIITIDGVTPLTGSSNGGTLITLTGTNFSKTINDNAVFLNSGQLNLQCYIVSASQTELVVRIPPAHADSTTYTIVMQGRLIEEAICNGDCSFTYGSKTGLPMVDLLDQSQFKNGESVTLTGTNFVVGDGATVEVNDTEYPVTVTSSTEMTFTIPTDLPIGQYVFLIVNGDSGFAGGFSGEVTLSVVSVSPAEFSNFGTDITITGSGFTEDSLVFIRNVQCPILTQSSTEITCIAPPMLAAGSYDITVQEPSYNPVKLSSAAKYRDNKTLTITSTNKTGAATASYDLSDRVGGWGSLQYYTKTQAAGSAFSITLVDYSSEIDTTAFKVYLHSTSSPSVRIEADTVTGVQATFNNPIAGSYFLKVWVEGYGFASPVVDSANSVWEYIFTLPTPTVTSGATTTLVGGTTLTLSGSGFDTEVQNNNEVFICGELCEVTSATSTQLECSLPSINTGFLLDNRQPTNQVLRPLFTEGVNNIKAVTTHQNPSINVSNTWDYSSDYHIINLSSDTIGQVEDTTCWVMFEAYDDSLIEFQSVQWHLEEGHASDRGVIKDQLFYEFTVEGSNDGTNWVEIANNKPYDQVNFRKGQHQHANYGYGGFNRDTPVTPYKYIKAIETATEARQNTCHYHSIHLFGNLQYATSVTTAADLSCSVEAKVQGQSASVSSQVTYDGVNTAQVTSVSPQYATIKGGDVLTISGSNFGSTQGDVTVTIDGITCSVTNLAGTNTITCTTGDNSASTNYKSNIEVLIATKPAFVTKTVLFHSGLLYSDEDTWNGELPPRKGDSIFVPKGQTLIVDESSDVFLDTVIVQGVMVFADNKALTFDAHNIIVKSGSFIIGSDDVPYTNDLTITMHGNFWDKQLPEFGNKVLGCHTCNIQLHGTPKTPTWSSLKASVAIGDKTLTIKDGNTNWQAGDIIAIATTDYYGSHSEEVRISSGGIAKNASGDVITFESLENPGTYNGLEFAHVSDTTTYGGKDLVMEAEVANLSRNVIFRGNPEDSITEKYGAHVKVHGSSLDGTIARISQVEFRYTGQPRILGRYNVHFHMIGNAINSQVEGIAVHNSYARVVAVHAVHNLRIADCVGYGAQGHNIFLEDGSETGNVVEGNLIISPVNAFNMLQTDITVAGIWITNPSNYLRHNHVAGSMFYGIWYEIKERTATTAAACPMGSEVLEVSNNVAHSNTRFGLRFFQLQPRKYPCSPSRNDLLEDPFSENPSIQTTYSSGTYYKNGECGILAEFLGNSIFEDMVLADNFRSGFQTHVTNYTAEHVILQDSFIIGKTVVNGETVDYESSAIILPRTDGFTAKNIQVFQMPAGTNIIESSSENDQIKLWTQGGFQSNIENISITDSDDAGKLKWIGGPMRSMVYDVDGSLTGTGNPTYYTPYYPHFDQVVTDGGCAKALIATGFSNLDTVQCTATLRSIKFGSMEDKDHFIGQKMKIFNLNDANKVFGDNVEEDFGESVSMKIKNPAKDCKDCYAAIIATDYQYNIHWNDGIDFSHAMVYPSYLAELADKTTIIRFNYVEQRELFDVYTMLGGQLIESISSSTDLTKFIDTNGKPNNAADGCELGDFFHDADNKLMYLCINGKGRDSKFQQVDLNGVYCRDTCPTEGFECEEKESKTRLFMDPNTDKNNEQYTDVELGRALVKRPGTEEWSYGVPQSGDDVKIPCEWSVSFNVASFEFGTLIIDGTLRISEEFENVHIKATNIWVRGGKLVAGEENINKRYSKNLTIELTGNKESIPLVIDDLSRTGTKSIAVTGKFELYGIYPETIQTRLTSTVDDGDLTLTLADDISDWQVGDQIVLGANAIRGDGFEKLTIKSIDDKNTITLEPTTPVTNWHYGHELKTVDKNNAEVNISNKFGGGLDMRCPVGNISRNIKIIGSDEAGLGGHLQVYHYILDDEKIGLHINARGSAFLEGVEFDNMGQHETNNAGLHIIYTNIPMENSIETVIRGSSFHDCFGYCVFGEFADHVTFDQNVFYEGEKFLIQALDTKYWTITDNLLIGAKLREGGATSEESHQWDPVALIHMWTPYTPSIHNFKVAGNVGSGSAGIGYAFPATPCEEGDDVQFYNNEVGYCDYIGILFNLKENMCYKPGYASVYHNSIGITLNNARSNDGWIATNIISAENKKNLVLHSASGNNIIHNNQLFDSWLSAYTRVNCVDCYTQARNGVNSRCSDVNGIQLHITTEGGESFPWVKSPFTYEVICVPPAVYGSSLINGVELHNFRDVFDSVDFPNAGQCGGNRGFRNHGSGADSHAGTYLTNVKCTNCDRDGLIYIMEPREAWRGWFGGCGIFDCTGMENMIIQDLTGDLLGYEGTIISNNEVIGYSEGMSDLCTFVPAWNAFDCQTTDFGVLEWNAEGDDKQEISPIPVLVSNDAWENNKINMWREWKWQGPEPLNQRLNRFTSLIHANQWHNITYSGTKSVDIMHKMQQRNLVGELDRHVIIKYHYSNPMALEVLVQGELKPTFPFEQPEDLDVHVTECGANNYYFDNSTVHFVITNMPDCQVEVRQVNSVFVNMRIAMSKEDFYSDDAAQTNFIDRISAFLHISFDRVRIVGLQSSARRMLVEETGPNTMIKFLVVGDVPSTAKAGYAPDQEYIKLQEFAQQIATGAESGELEEDLGYKIVDTSYEVVVLKEAGTDGNDGDFFKESDLDKNNQDGNKKKSNDDDTTTKEDRDQMIAIALGIIFGIIGVVLITMIVYHLWKKHQVKKIHCVQEHQIPQSENDFSQKPDAKIEAHHSHNDIESKSQHSN